MGKKSIAGIYGPIGGFIAAWKGIKSFSAAEIARESQHTFRLALIGTDEQTGLLAARLALETPKQTSGPARPVDIQPFISRHEDDSGIPPGSIRLYAAEVVFDEERLVVEILGIMARHPDLRLSLARHIPAFRPAVTSRIIHESSWQNARIAVISALPGVLPLTDILLPAASVGDMLLLTRNQAMLLLKIAAAYGLPVDLRARAKELLPIVGSGFGWRAAARELVGLVPGGVGVAVKGAVSYAGTYSVGKAAALYYSTGMTVSGSRLRAFYREGYKDISGRIRELIRPKGRLTALPENADILDNTKGFASQANVKENQ